MKKFLKDVIIEKIGYGGVGIATASNGKKILIKGGALPGSIVDCRIVKRKKDYIQAHIVSVKSQDPQWTDGTVFCPHYFVPTQASQENKGSDKIGCGGCKRQIVSYEKQLQLKQDLIQDCMKRIEGLDIKPIIGSELNRGYRNKIEFSFGVYISQKDGIESRRNLGFHKQGEFSKIVDIDNCGLISTKANQIYEYIKTLCYNSGFRTYDQKFHQGTFRHLAIREGINTDQFMINLAVSDKEFDEDQKIKRIQFLEQIKNDEYLKNAVNTFIVSYNNGLADIIRNSDTRVDVIWGEGYIYEKLIFSEDNEINFRISPYSFFQTNTIGAQQLFASAYELVGLVEGDILDLYCGTGSIGISFLKLGMGDKLIGVETVSDAITDARHNAKINGLEDRAMFFASNSEKMFDEYPVLREKISNIGLIIVDPPREGLHKNVVDFLIKMKKELGTKIIYISCNPITMARDLLMMQEEGVSCKTIQPVDMFPHTHHIEVIGII